MSVNMSEEVGSKEGSSEKSMDASEVMAKGVEPNRSLSGGELVMVSWMTGAWISGSNSSSSNPEKEGPTKAAASHITGEVSWQTCRHQTTFTINKISYSNSNAT